MYLAYTYLITNKITNQFYYGFRCGNIRAKRTPKEDLWIRYFTSSKRVRALIREYGKDSFDIQIIMENDWQKCYEYEQKMISEHLGKELCLNKRCHLTNKWSTAGVPISEEQKANHSIRMRGENHPMYGKTSSKKGKPISDEQKAKISAANTGKHRSEETKEKMSVSKMGSNNPNKNGLVRKGAIVSDEQKRKSSLALSGEKSPLFGMPPHNKGMKASEDTKAKMSASHKGKPSGKKGKPISEEQKIKQRESMRAYYERKKMPLK